MADDPGLSGPAFRSIEEEKEILFTKKTIRDIEIDGKRVLVRVDFNVPLKNGAIVDDTRIKAALPTIRYLIDHGCRVILVSHLGRPKGKIDAAYRLDSVAERLALLLNIPVKKLDETVGGGVTAAVEEMAPGDVILLENIRFNPGESENNPEFARHLADLADVFVNDAFGAAHREHASTVGVTNYLPSVAGLLLEMEISNLAKLISSPRRPFLAVLGGNKVSDKIGVIERFLDNIDAIMTGGGMCFTFLKARGLNIGASLVETEQLKTAETIMKKAEERGVSFYLPSDVIISQEISPDAVAKRATVDQIPDGWMGLDIGPGTIDVYRSVIARAETIFWNGPMGVFEIDNFAQGTYQVAEAIAERTRRGALSIVGGGDSDAALKQFDLEDKISFVSTGGGASLKVLEGTVLPGVEALMDRGTGRNNA